MDQFKDIQVLIWDFDGTFFKSKQKLLDAIREGEYRTIIGHTGWSREKTIAEFKKYYKVITPSATETVAYLCRMTTPEAVREMEKFYDRRKFVRRNQKLINFFSGLTKFQHFILANGVKKNLIDTMRVLGLSPEIFSEIITSELVGQNKPSLKGFEYILQQTALPASYHLMIGDREAVDLTPAKKLGMHTCLVWADPKGIYQDAEIILPTVYDVNNLFK